MADFVAVLRRAVGNLQDNTAPARQVIYGKARTALRAQLEAIDPPLGPEDIGRQIKSLDEAIGELEAEYSAPAGGANSEDRPETPKAEPKPEPRIERPAGATPPPPKPQALQSAVSEAGALGGATSTAARQARATLKRIDSDGEEPRPGAPARTEPQVSRHQSALEPKPAPKVDRPAAPASVYEEDEGTDRGGAGRVVAWVILLAVLAGIAGVGYWQRDTVMEMVADLQGAEESSESAAENGKIDDRIPSGSAQAPTTDTPVRTAQIDNPQPTDQASPAPAAPPPAATAEGERASQALLIEESVGGVNSANTLGGTVDWKLLDDTEAVGGADKIIRGDVIVPERDLAMTITIRRNKDEALPASHLIELIFTPGEQFEHQGVASIPGILMKATPRSTGQPLVGAVVPVMDGYFLVGLSESDIDRERNVQEITARDFMDIPVTYKDGGRAVLSLAKGDSGNQVFADAFAAWSQ